MTAIRNFRDIDALAVQGPPVKLAALAAHERECMLTIKLAFERGYVIPCLVGDPEKKIVTAYGVPLVDLPVGQVAKRSVFLIGKTGTIRYIDPAYDVSASKDALYAALKQIKKAKPSGARRSRAYPGRVCPVC